MPKKRTDPVEASGRAIMRRKIAWRVVGIPNRAAKRVPPLPLVASPMEVICWQCRIVILAHGSTKEGKRSAKTFREHAGLRQENLRTVRTNWTQRPAQGASRRVRR